MTVTIWHNPRCSKSRQTLALLEANDAPVEVRHYLQSPPTEAELHWALAQLEMPAKELLRKGEKLFKDLGLKGVADENALIAAMATHPILIERPIAFSKGKARIGRPPEAVLDIL
jgi:arsenate reductase